MKNQRKIHSILEVILLSVYLIIFLEPSILSAQDTESQQVGQNQEELNQALFTAVTNNLVEEVKELIWHGMLNLSKFR